jgi:hypothetical protein
MITACLIVIFFEPGDPLRPPAMGIIPRKAEGAPYLVVRERAKINTSGDRNEIMAGRPGATTLAVPEGKHAEHVREPDARARGGRRRGGYFFIQVKPDVP